MSKEFVIKYLEQAVRISRFKERKSLDMLPYVVVPYSQIPIKISIIEKLKP